MKGDFIAALVELHRIETGCTIENLCQECRQELGSEAGRASRASATIELPWTAPPLSMNDRGRTAGAMYAKARTVAKVRRTVQILAAAQPLPRGVAHVSVHLHYRPRDNRRRDTDNLIATLKPICDALAAGTPKHPGYGMVPDDIPRYMAKPEPTIHAAERGKPGALWLEITWTEEA